MIDARVRMKDYRELEAYKVSKKMSLIIHKYTESWPKAQLFGLTGQIQRASISVISNLAEGIGRITSKDTCHFLAMARGSCYEIEAQIDLANALGYVTDDQYKEVQLCVDQTKKLLNGLYRRYENLA